MTIGVLANMCPTFAIAANNVKNTKLYIAHGVLENLLETVIDRIDKNEKMQLMHVNDDESEIAIITLTSTPYISDKYKVDGPYYLILLYKVCSIEIDAYYYTEDSNSEESVYVEMV